ncbi:hypothetical protein PGT21_006722 [Puccinia graminis f. sp. tritici]|uniref:Secreted protein n=1 Tax=Puccinia graminis f. sp. tritici TaxID=56615 RepID=A0A5B0QEH3_PUCGR|nr:hypothetical protein PGT21_006722 [Puccinia graminis f. sp. tritici]
MSILRAWFAFTLLMCFMVTTMSASYTAVCAACGTPATIECREATLGEYITYDHIRTCLQAGGQCQQRIYFHTLKLR